MRRNPLGAAILAFALGCQSSPPESDPLVPIDQVPPKVLETARKQLPEINFDTVYKMTFEGKEAYEVRGKDKRGKMREVEVAADGTLIAVE
ncbi:MAG: hypothetical protein ACLQGP_01195 [Isosphaeraceae bacterium]